MERVKGWWAAAQRTPAGQAWKRYSDSKGNLLAGGVTYFGFLSIFPVLALAFTVFGILLRDNPQWLDRIREAVSDALPGFVQDDAGNGLIPLEVPGGDTLATVGIVGVVGLLWGGLGWLGALREGIVTIFGVKGKQRNAAIAKLRDLGVLVVIGLAVLVSVAVSTAANAVAAELADLIGLGAKGWLVTLVGVLLQALFNTAIVAIVLRVLSGVPLPWHGLRNGAVFGGLGLTVLQLFGTRLIAGTMSNPVFASIALVVGLLVFLNFMSRVILVSAAWAANDLDSEQAGTALNPGQRRKLVEGPEPEAMATVQDRVDAGLPTFGQRAADRSTLAAGAVLGATGAVALGSVLRGLRSLVSRGRG